MELPPRPYPEEYGEDGNDIRMDIELIPKQGEGKTDRTREIHVQPLFRILRLHGYL
jgi:hypothetical protein